LTSHDAAERLLLDKIEELNLPFNNEASAGARANLDARLDRLGIDGDRAHWQWERWIEDGIQALLAWLKENHAMRPDALQRLQKTAHCLYTSGWLTPDQVFAIPEHPMAAVPTGAAARQWHKAGGVLTDAHRAALARFKREMEAAERWAVEEAERKLAGLRQEHRTLTLSWAKATDAMQAVLKAEIERLEADIRHWEPRTVPLSRRIEELRAAEEERMAERRKLLDEWPALEGCEKGEALRLLFKTVALF
jgi:hypothetical protein